MNLATCEIYIGSLTVKIPNDIKTEVANHFENMRQNPSRTALACIQSSKSLVEESRENEFESAIDFLLMGMITGIAVANASRDPAFQKWVGGLYEFAKRDAKTNEGNL